MDPVIPDRKRKAMRRPKLRRPQTDRVSVKIEWTTHELERAHASCRKVKIQSVVL